MHGMKTANEQEQNHEKELVPIINLFIVGINWMILADVRKEENQT